MQSFFSLCFSFGYAYLATWFLHLIFLMHLCLNTHKAQNPVDSNFLQSNSFAMCTSLSSPPIRCIYRPDKVLYLNDRKLIELIKVLSVFVLFSDSFMSFAKSLGILKGLLGGKFCRKMLVVICFTIWGDTRDCFSTVNRLFQLCNYF